MFPLSLTVGQDSENSRTEGLRPAAGRSLPHNVC